MKLISKAKRILRGEVSPRLAVREAARRVRSLNERRRERAALAELERQPARLREEFARVQAPDLLAHFRSRLQPRLLPGFQHAARSAELQQKLVPQATAQLIDQARRIVDEHSWPLLGFGEMGFGKEGIDWNRDPLSGFNWPLDYHADINLMRNDGSDARVVWELNRLSHFITLGRAYAITNDNIFSNEFFQQFREWRRENPRGRGVNWSCAMEVALRAINLLAAFELFLRAPEMDDVVLKDFLKTFDQHGAHIQRNLEFSHIANSNHYVADVTGLLWLGVMLPELQAAAKWRAFGLRELLKEMDQQILPDGADNEASTGYHRLKAEMFLYSFVLCHLNQIDIDEKYWSKLRAMIAYARAYVRPAGDAPLLGDSDSGQLLPILRRRGDDHAYLLAIGAAVFHEPRFKLASSNASEEVIWILGERGVLDYRALPYGEAPGSQAFPNAGTYVLREDDLYLLFNASDSGINGRGSHGHNDALSIEVAASGTTFIIDPGSYIYVGNLRERHLFRSTAYHSTVQVDGQEQNKIDEAVPFIIGNEARPRVLSWEMNADADTVVAEHYGYRCLAKPVTHRRSVRFDKRNRFWLVEDELAGAGKHEISTRFHFDANLEIKVYDATGALARDRYSGARLLIQPLDGTEQPQFEEQFTSRDYGQKQQSVAACWSIHTPTPCKMRWLLLPIAPGEDGVQRQQRIENLLK
ncbi:MAG: alginate lyase family protein [Pyrinomonadaceae bacterium]